jgi:hypothetical protein
MFILPSTYIPVQRINFSNIAEKKTPAFLPNRARNIMGAENWFIRTFRAADSATLVRKKRRRENCSIRNHLK